MAGNYSDVEAAANVEITPSVKFGREVVELALDYFRHRYGALDYRTPPSKPENSPLFRLSAVLMRREARQYEFTREHVKLFHKFQNTLIYLKTETGCKADHIPKVFATDLMNNILDDCPSSQITWYHIVKFIVMTTTFVRHVLDGGKCVANVKRLFNGLNNAIRCLDDDVVLQLGGWGQFSRCYEGKQVLF